MWKYALLVLCFVSLFFDCTTGQSGNYEFVAPSRTEELQKKVPSRIVNGTKAVLGQFPQQVSLRRRYTESHFCGGSILTPDWILTAGHCMLDNSGQHFIDAYSIIVIAGEIVLKNKNRAHQWSYVSRRIVHPKFDLNTLHNDLTLLKLEKPLVFDPYVKPVPLMRDPMVPHTVCQVSGWGYQKFEGSVSAYLLYVDVPLLPIRLCRKLLYNYSLVPPGMFCAGYMEGGRDACQGDSGGGILCEGYLTGVVSGGEGCAWPRLPGLYADVNYYLAWIESYVDLDRNYSVQMTRYNGGSLQSTSVFAILVCVLGALFNF